MRAWVPIMLWSLFVIAMTGFLGWIVPVVAVLAVAVADFVQTEL